MHFKIWWNNLISIELDVVYLVVVFLWPFAIFGDIKKKRRFYMENWRQTSKNWSRLHVASRGFTMPSRAFTMPSTIFFRGWNGFLWSSSSKKIDALESLFFVWRCSGSPTTAVLDPKNLSSCGQVASGPASVESTVLLVGLYSYPYRAGWYSLSFFCAYKYTVCQQLPYPRLLGKPTNGPAGTKTRPAGRPLSAGKSSRFFVSGFYSEFEMGA